jgi:N-acetylneuraminic acid mutarotase
LSHTKTTVINTKVYCGGEAYGDDQYIVYCYDPSQDRWTTLSPLPVRWFGLGQVNGKLVAVGGWKKSTGNETKDVYTNDERSQKWKQTIPPMPTARRSPGVLSLQSALVVAGGSGATLTYSDTADIFKPDTSQWYRTDLLPIACCNISLVAIGNTCYALGGYNGSHLNQALYASVDDLFGNAVPAKQITHSGSSDTQSAWKTLPNTPTYRPAAAVLAGNLLAIGGRETSKEGADMMEVYMYSPSANSWIYISDLPSAPRSFTAVAVLSSTEILVIGGWVGHGRVNTVYKGMLTVL